MIDGYTRWVSQHEEMQYVTTFLSSSVGNTAETYWTFYSIRKFEMNLEGLLSPTIPK
jgi:hypothetical protein